jgi:two-component system response regulator RegA|tara:strand:- start:2668 stop:3195 length:528 start_codon:yes stop_codon:yes gene_type:complete
MRKELIIIDDDFPFRDRLSRSMKKKGFNVEIFGDIKQTKKRIKEKLFDYAIVDMRLENGSGLELIKLIKKINPKTRALLLTGYGNIATAVAAIKSGAIDYLTKPAAIDQIYESLLFSKDTLPSPPLYPMTANRARWEHIQRVFIQCKRNVSETARRLRMHRRTLQRILNKHAPKE